MPITTLVIALALAVVIVESRSGRRRGGGSWGAFAAWLTAGFLSALATISFAIGLLVLPFALVAIAVASRFGLWPPVLGFVAGAGLVGVLVWALSVGESEGPGYATWLAAGTAVALASAGAFAAVRQPA